MFEVIIVGLGTSGSQALYHLTSLGITNILCLDLGTPGAGPSEIASGSAVFVDGPQCIKMTVTLPPYDMLDEYARHHGWQGVQKQLGSVMLCEQDMEIRLKQEYEYLKKMRQNCELWEKDKIIEQQGIDSKFTMGIWFPDDCIINSQKYSQKICEFASSKGATIKRNCSQVQKIHDLYNKIIVELQNGEKFEGKKVVVATGGYYMDENLAGILSPCYSYLVSIKKEKEIQKKMSKNEKGMYSDNSPNYFTLGFSHDWCVSDSFVRISGEDHFSAFKDSLVNTRCLNLSEFVFEKYPFIARSPFVQQHGVYSSTIDHLPLLGNTNDNSQVYYLLGCNAWGQASLSAAASLITGLMGFRNLNSQENLWAQFISIRRFKNQFKAINSKL